MYYKHRQSKNRCGPKTDGTKQQKFISKKYDLFSVCVV